MDLKDLNRTLVALLAQALDGDNSLRSEDAARQLAVVAKQSGLQGLDARLIELAGSFRRRGVLNPLWLRDQGIRPHFFLVTGCAGHIDQVIRDTNTPSDGVSQYVLYGDWDSLLALSGSEAEAERVMDRLGAGAYEDATAFDAKEILLCYQHRVIAPGPTTILGADTINSVVLDYDDHEQASLRKKLLASHQLLGGTWTFDGGSPYPVLAWVGITLRRGRRSLAPQMIMDMLLKQDVLRRCLVHLFTVETGQPYHLFAKLACTSLTELENASSAIAHAGTDGVKLEGSTYVVASGSDSFLLIRKPDLLSVPISPDIGSIRRNADYVFANLNANERTAFNMLPDARQIAVMRALVGLLEAVEGVDGDETFSDRVFAAVDSFSHEATRLDGEPNFASAVAAVVSAVEALTKDLLVRLTTICLGTDEAQQQGELPPPDRIGSLSWNEVVAAFHRATENPAFGQNMVLAPDRLHERMSAFSVMHNGRSRDALAGFENHVIDDAYRAMRDGILLGAAIVDALKSLEGEPGNSSNIAHDAVIPSPGSERSNFRIFISHSGDDKAITERVATRLRAAGYASWYSEWELSGGDSIVDRIQRALNQADVLIVMLSKASVRSRWVERELNSTLMRQLDGSDVQVIPLRLDDCQMPRLLSDLKNVDLRGDFETGFRSLLDALQRRDSP